jgi:DNA-binding CsgD family transcriptional regulator
MGRNSGKRGSAETLSAHEAGKFTPHRGKSGAPVRYSAKDQDSPSPLTVREEEVLSWLAKGKSNIEIGDLAQIKTATVEKHIENIYPKLGVNSRAEAAIWFLETQDRSARAGKRRVEATTAIARSLGHAVARRGRSTVSAVFTGSGSLTENARHDVGHDLWFAEKARRFSRKAHTF